MAKLRLYIAIPEGTMAEELEVGSALVSVSHSPDLVAPGWPRYVVDVDVPLPAATRLEEAAAVRNDDPLLGRG